MFLELTAPFLKWWCDPLCPVLALLPGWHYRTIRRVRLPCLCPITGAPNFYTYSLASSKELWYRLRHGITSALIFSAGDFKLPRGRRNHPCRGPPGPNTLFKIYQTSFENLPQKPKACW